MSAETVVPKTVVPETDVSETSSPTAGVREIRAPRREELGQLVELCREHAAYEKGELGPRFRADTLGDWLFAPRPRVHCLVAVAEELVGYATWNREFSTWSAGEFIHMDCLYVRSAWRSQGLGARLLEAVIEAGALAGLAHLEWQSPAWNTGALRFYRRHGAHGSEKVRFRLDLPRERVADPSHREAGKLGGP